MRCSSFHAFACRRSWRVTFSLPTVALMVLLLWIGTTNASTGTSASASTTSASCEGSGDGRCDSKNNYAPCDYDGGDCCAYSCTDGAMFSCGVVGYTCLDLSAPEYDEYSEYDDDGDVTDSFGGKVLNFIIGGVVLILIFGGVCSIVNKVCMAKLLERVHGQESGWAHASEESGIEDSKQKTAGFFFAWFLLALELGVAIVLFTRGEGRISKQMSMKDPEYPLLPAEDTCVEGEGPQLVSYATFYRCGVAVMSQLVLWGLGEGRALPERSFLRAIVACLARCTGNTSWSQSFSYRSQWSGYLILVISVHMLWPLVIDVMALCALETDVQIWFFIVLGTTICCCNSTCTMAPGEGGLLHVVDAVFNGVLGTWANVVQSGMVFGVVFALLPTFEILYSILELFLVCNTLPVQQPGG